MSKISCNINISTFDSCLLKTCRLHSEKYGLNRKIVRVEQLVAR